MGKEGVTHCLTWSCVVSLGSHRVSKGFGQKHLLSLALTRVFLVSLGLTLLHLVSLFVLSFSLGSNFLSLGFTWPLLFTCSRMDSLGLALSNFVHLAYSIYLLMSSKGKGNTCHWKRGKEKPRQKGERANLPQEN